MPRLKDRTDTMRRLLNAYELNNGSQLAPVIGCSRATAYKRINDPSELTLGELRLLVTRGHIPIEEVRAAV